MAEKGKYGRFKFEEMYNSFLGLEQREQTFVVIGAIILLLVLMLVPASCATSKLASMEEDFQNVRKSSRDLATKLAEYEQIKSELDGVKKKLLAGKNESLATVLEKLATEEGIVTANVDKFTPGAGEGGDNYDEDVVDASYSKITLSQALNYVQKIESYPTLPLSIKQMTLKPAKDRQTFSLSFKVSAIKLKGGSGE